MEDNSNLQFVSTPDVPSSSARVILEYVFGDHTNYQFWSKVRVVDSEPKSVKGYIHFSNSMYFFGVLQG
jgi:hypothetical protein